MPPPLQLQPFFTHHHALATFGLFLSAEIAPGPGIFYVITRSLKGDLQEGIASSLGTAVGGMFHNTTADFVVAALVPSARG
ncbi:MAG: hypothetical protein ACFB0C_08075 [Leptolyngbyaceae cyanobacterium]